MPKYLYQVAYTPEGSSGVLRGGGSNRVKVVKELVEGLGGKVDLFAFAFGDDDAILVLDLPDHVTASAIGLAVNASGAARSKIA